MGDTSDSRKNRSDVRVGYMACFVCIFYPHSRDVRVVCCLWNICRWVIQETQERTGLTCVHVIWRVWFVYSIKVPCSVRGMYIGG